MGYLRLAYKITIQIEYFQFPLWDTKELLSITRFSFNLTFNSLYGIQRLSRHEIIKGIILSIPFMGYEELEQKVFDLQNKLSIPFMGYGYK